MEDESSTETWSDPNIVQLAGERAGPSTPSPPPEKTEEGGKKKLETVEFDELKVVDKIGHGAFSVVFRGVWVGTPVAIKRLRSADASTLGGEEGEGGLGVDLEKEVRVLSLLSHPNCISLLAVCNHPPAIVTELLGEGDLKSHLFYRDTVLEDSLRLRIASSIAAGMAYLHRKGVIHRDLKPANVLVDCGFAIIKIADFGLSDIIAAYTPSPPPTLGGTQRYMAPELFLGHAGTPATDVYAFGITLHELLYRTKATYDAPRGVNAYAKLLPPPLGTDASHFLASLLQSVLKGTTHTDPCSRPSFEAIIPLLETAGAALHLGALSSSVPLLPSDDIVPRKEDHAALASLVCDTEPPNMVAVFGSPGSGKTMLTAGIARDESIRRAHPLGIFWITLGAMADERSIRDQISALARTVASRMDAHPHVLPRILVVMDDASTAQSTSDALTALLTETHALACALTLVVTTRSTRILDDVASQTGVEWERFRVQDLDPDTALLMLTKWSGLPLARLPPTAARFATFCSDSPLLLAMSGVLIRVRPGSFTRIMADFDSLVASTSYPELEIMDLAVMALSFLSDHYTRLVVFREDMVLTKSLLLALWGGNTTSILHPDPHLVVRVDALIDLLVERLLLQDETDGTFSVHALPYRYLVWKSPPHLVRTWHAIFLQSMASALHPPLPSHPSHPDHPLPDSTDAWMALGRGHPLSPQQAEVLTYLQAHTVFHLVHAGFRAQAAALVQDPRYVAMAVSKAPISWLIADIDTVLSAYEGDEGSGADDEDVESVVHSLHKFRSGLHET